jgi:2-dehydro-3-deoxyphosphogalactonate aldolase
MTIPADFRIAFSRCPLVAILRGVSPCEVVSIGEELVAAGITLIEVPLNSPEPLRSISLLVGALQGRAVIGGGTVLTVAQVAQVADNGGRFIVSPNSDSLVIAETVTRGITSLPGYFTPSEGLAALAAGAHALKLFPAEAGDPRVLKAHRAILPGEVPILVVGGITPDDMAEWLVAGADGFGLGSAIYRKGVSPENVRLNAKHFVEAWRRLCSNTTKFPDDF